MRVRDGGPSRLVWNRRLGAVVKIDADELAARSREIDEQREHLTARPAPLFTQQQSVLQTLVSAWDGMNAGEKKQTLAGIFDSITASADGVDRLEPCEDWRPFMVAAIPNPVLVAGDVEGVNGAEDGGQARGSGNNPTRSGRARVAPVGRLTLWSNRAESREAVNVGH